MRLAEVTCCRIVKKIPILDGRVIAAVELDYGTLQYAGSTFCRFSSYFISGRHQKVHAWQSKTLRPWDVIMICQSLTVYRTTGSRQI